LGFARRICHGERTRDRLPFFRGDCDVDILTRPELDRRIQLDLNAANVMRQLLEIRDPPLERLDGDGLGQDLFVVIQQIDRQIVEGLGPAHQDLAAVAFAVVQREGRIFQHLDLAVDQHAFAGRTLAFLAAVRQRDALAECGVEDGFILVHLEFHTHGLQPYGVNLSHSVRPPRRQSGSLSLPRSCSGWGGGRVAAPTVWLSCRR